jgi:ribosomal subunit interface protein
MKLEKISWSNVEPTSAVEEYVRMRIQKLSKIVQKMEPATIQAEVGKPLSRRKKEGDLFYVELHASIQGKDFHVSKTDLIVYRAVERARSDMHQQIIRWKKKERSLQKKQGALIKRMLRSGSGHK